MALFLTSGHSKRFTILREGDGDGKRGREREDEKGEMSATIIDQIKHVSVLL